MPSRLVSCVKASLARTSRSDAVPAPQTVFSAVRELAAILGNKRGLIDETLAELDKSKSLDTIAVCSIAALLVSTPADEVRADFDAGTTTLCSALWEAIAAESPADGDVECAALCAASLYPDRGSAAIVDAASDVLRGASDPAPFKTLAAVDIIAAVVHAATTDRSAEQWASLARTGIVDVALACAGTVQSNAAVVPAVTRKILIPLLRVVDNTVREETFERVVGLARSLFADGHLSEAIVLVASLFDFLFPADAKAAVRDLRHEAFLWELLAESLRSSGVRVTRAGGPTQVVHLHLQAVYLLKRLVSFTVVRNGKTEKSPAVEFHPMFPWVGKASDTAWASFFLLSDSLNEYGLHIVSPALERLPTLATTTATNGALASAWVEILFDKAAAHANTGVRKLALGCLWGSSQELVGQRLTRHFICVAAFQAACDTRLCSEPDKVVLPGSFLDAKATAGKPAHNLPVLQPVAERLTAFYVRYFATLPSDEVRQECLVTLLEGFNGATVSRFGMTVTARLLQALGTQDYHASLMSPDALRALGSLVTEEVHDKHAGWLEARMCAILSDALLTLATPALVTEPAFRSVFSGMTRGGATGGTGLASVDVTGTAGTIGTGLPHWILLDRTLALREQRPALAAFVADGQLTLEGVARFISAGTTDAAVAKESVCTLLASESAAGIVAVADAALHVGDRTSIAPQRALATFLLFSEVAAVIADKPGTSLELPANPVALLQSVLQFGVGALERAMAATADAVAAEALADGDWFTMRVESFDVVCAAAFECTRRLTASQLQGCSIFDTVDRLLAFSDRCTTKYAEAAQEYARIACLRNAMRLAHAIVTAAIAGEGKSLHDLSVWHAYSTEERIKKILFRPQPRLTVPDTPTPLSSRRWGMVTAQCERNTMQLGLAMLDARGDDVTQDLVKRIGSRASDLLDECSSQNVSSAYDLLAWVCVHAEEELEIEVGMWIGAMQNRLRDDIIRRESQRCSATLAFVLCGVKVAKDECDAIIEEITEDDETTDRTAVYVASAIAAHTLADASGETYTRFKGMLLHFALFRNHSHGEDELEAALAVSEPCVAGTHWDVLRRTRAPWTGSGAVARAAAISTILKRAELDHDEAVSLFNTLLEWNDTHPLVTKQPCMPDSPTHRIKIRLWQLLIGLTPLMRKEDWPSVIETMCSKTLEIINMGSVRRYMELLLMAAVRVCPEAYTLVRDRLRDPDLRAQVCSSHALTAIHTLKRYGLEDEKMRSDIVPLIVRLSSSNYHIIRLIAQIGLHDLAQDERWAAILSPDVLAIVYAVEHSSDAKKFRERYLETVVFDDEAAIEPVANFSTQRKEGDNWLLDAIPPLVFDRVRFIGDELSSLLAANSPWEFYRCRQLLTQRGVNAVASLDTLGSLELIPHARTPEDSYLDFAREVIAQAEEARVKGNSDTENLQRKVTSWWQSEVHNELHPRAVGTRSRQSLIVVATLLDYAVNIAGLCRCAEIFAIEKVVVPDRKVFSNKEFVSVARSAELWLPWEEVPQASLATYLGTMRQLGYTIVAVEQTSDSVPLQTYEFPERTVVVLGAEGTGIPANFLPCVDVCLEIPQFGLIRSLNVHVTGAVAMYEYTRQHLMEKGAASGAGSAAAIEAGAAAAVAAAALPAA